MTLTCNPQTAARKHGTEEERRGGYVSRSPENTRYTDRTSLVHPRRRVHRAEHVSAVQSFLSGNTWIANLFPARCPPPSRSSLKRRHDLHLAPMGGDLSTFTPGEALSQVFLEITGVKCSYSVETNFIRRLDFHILHLKW